MIAAGRGTPPVRSVFSHKPNFKRDCRGAASRRLPPFAFICSSAPADSQILLTAGVRCFTAKFAKLRPVQWHGTSAAPLRFSSAKSLVCIFCSFVNALTTKILHYQLFAVSKRSADLLPSAFAVIRLRFLRHGVPPRYPRRPAAPLSLTLARRGRALAPFGRSGFARLRLAMRSAPCGRSARLTFSYSSYFS